MEVAQLEVNGIFYDYAFSNCNVTAAFIQLSTPSLATCAAMCTESTHEAFAMREGDCGLMEACPLCCNSTNGEAGGWSVYCPRGKALTI